MSVLLSHSAKEGMRLKRGSEADALPFVVAHHVHKYLCTKVSCPSYKQLNQLRARDNYNSQDDINIILRPGVYRETPLLSFALNPDGSQLSISTHARAVQIRAKQLGRFTWPTRAVNIVGRTSTQG